MLPPGLHAQPQQRGYAAAAGGGGGGAAKQSAPQGWRDPLASGVKRRANEFVCELCGVVCSSQSTLDNHYKGRGHKRKVKMQKNAGEGGAPLQDSRQMRISGWDGTVNADGTRDEEPQITAEYDKTHNSAYVPQMAWYYSAAMKKKREKWAEMAEQDDKGGGKKGKGNKGPDPVAPYRRRIGLANRDGEVDEGIAAFDEMHAAGFKAETKTCNAVLVLCAESKRWADAQRVYDEIKQRYKPDEGTFTCMIRLCGATEQLGRGLELYAEMKEAKIKPKRRTFTPLFRACAQQPDGAVEQSLALLADAKSLDINVFEEDYAYLVQSCARAGAVGAAKCQEVVLPHMMDACYLISASTRDAVAEWGASVAKREAPTVARADDRGRLCGMRLQSLALTEWETRLMLDQISSLASTDKRKTVGPRLPFGVLFYSESSGSSVDGLAASRRRSTTLRGGWTRTGPSTCSWTARTSASSTSAWTRATS